MTRAAARQCMASKANGSLMRATPLGIWGHRLDDETLAHYADQDSSLSHPNRSCCDAVICYTFAIASLLNKPGDRTAAFERVSNWAAAHADDEVQGWLRDADRNVDVPYHPMDGFVKIAFTHAFRHLLLGSDYVTAVRETLLGGGDTDTNACIVGGLIGAACGAEAIPEEMKSAVLRSIHGLGSHLRPAFLHPSQVPETRLWLGGELAINDPVTDNQ